jgi:hypothetical protein
MMGLKNVAENSGYAQHTSNIVSGPHGATLSEEKGCRDNIQQNL